MVTYKVEYVEDFSGPSMTKMLADRLTQQTGQGRTDS